MDAQMNTSDSDIDYEIGSTKLSPRQIINRDSFAGESKIDNCGEIYNYFQCNICLKVLVDPVECTKCQTAFCKECIAQWFSAS